MDRLFSYMTERPEKSAIAGAVCYMLFGFTAIGYVSQLLLGDVWQRVHWRSWLEFGVQLLHFAFALAVFWRLFSESALTVRLDKKKFFGTVALGTVLILAVSDGVYQLLPILRLHPFLDVASWAMPILPHETVVMADFLVEQSPVLGLICMTVLAPVAVSCIFYVPFFGTVSEEHPALAYLAVAAALAASRLLNVLFVFQPVSQELPLYLFQLPLHWIACWSYQKTDTLWTPVAVLSAANLISCIVTLI